MSKINSYLPQQAAVMASPIAYTSTAGSASVAAFVATNNANLDKLIEMISLEEADASVSRFWLDEMSPAARVTLYKTLKDLKSNSIA